MSSQTCDLLQTLTSSSIQTSMLRSSTKTLSIASVSQNASSRQVTWIWLAKGTNSNNFNLHKNFNLLQHPKLMTQIQQSNLSSALVSLRSTIIASLLKLGPVVTQIWTSKDICFKKINLLRNLNLLRHLKFMTQIQKVRLRRSICTNHASLLKIKYRTNYNLDTGSGPKSLTMQVRTPTPG